MLRRLCFFRISAKSPIVQQNRQLFELMVKRRKIHKMFDMIKCEQWTTILEKNGFASEKNLVLKDTVFSSDQIREIKAGTLS